MHAFIRMPFDQLQCCHVYGHCIDLSDFLEFGFSVRDDPRTHSFECHSISCNVVMSVDIALIFPNFWIWILCAWRSTHAHIALTHGLRLANRIMFFWHTGGGSWCAQYSSQHRRARRGCHHMDPHVPLRLNPVCSDMREAVAGAPTTSHDTVWSEGDAIMDPSGMRSRSTSTLPAHGRRLLV